MISFPPNAPHPKSETSWYAPSEYQLAGVALASGAAWLCWECARVAKVLGVGQPAKEGIMRSSETCPWCPPHPLFRRWRFSRFLDSPPLFKNLSLPVLWRFPHTQHQILPMTPYENTMLPGKTSYREDCARALVVDSAFADVL